MLLFCAEALMSLKDQLLRLKKCRRALHSGERKRVQFGDTEDMDDETILELIPIRTPYTRTKSLLFDRQKQTEEEERRFNRKFSGFLKELVRYGETKDIEYLLDYLVRRYSCDTFNPKEMIFALLPFKQYYRQVLHISGKSDFNYFTVQPTYSYQFIGNLCLKEKYFFDFFVEYFKHFRYIRGFCLSVLGYIVSGLRNTDKDFSMQLFEILSHLVRSGENSTASDLFFEIRDYVEEALDEFVGLLAPYFNKEYLMSRKPEKMEHKAAIPHEEAAFFSSIYSSGKDREILGDCSRYKSYVVWLHREGLALRSISEHEFRALKVLCGVEKKDIEGEASDYAELLKDLKDRKKLVELLARRFPRDISVLIPHMGDDDKAHVSGLFPGLWRSLITEDNHAMLIMNMPRGAVKEDLIDIMATCLKYVKYDASVFVEYLDNEMLLALMEQCSEDLSVWNIIETSKLMGTDLTSAIIQKRLYANPAYLNYLSEKPRGLAIEVSKRIFEKVVESPEKRCLDALCRYLHQISDQELVNDILGWLVDKAWFYPALYSGLTAHLELLSEKNCERILDLRGFSEKNYFVVDRLYRYRENTVDECLMEKHYGALLFLCKRYGFSKVLGDRRDKCTMDFIRDASKQSLSPEEADGFVQYSSSLIGSGDGRVIEALLQGKYIPHLIKCTMLKEWSAVKIIIIELILQYPQHRQLCFDYFLSNYLDFKEDFDLLEVVAGDEVAIDYEKLVEVFRGSEGYFRSRLFDILLKNSSFDSLRFVPMIVPSMIEYKRESIGILFEKHKDIMGPYVKDVLLGFPEIEDCMLEVNPRHLLIGSVGAYADSQDEHHLDFMYKVLSIPHASVSLPTLERVVEFLRSNVSRVKDKLLARFFEVYLKAHPEASEKVQTLLRTIYESRRSAFFEISKASLSSCYGIFKPYVNIMVDMIEEKDRDAIAFMADYLYWDLECDVPHRKLFEILFGFYCNEPDVLYARCIGSILRHCPAEIEDANDLILSHMRGDRVVVILELLQVLYQKVYHFKKCLVKSSPYFALVVDSTRKDISSAARKLLSIIERKHNKSGYQVLQL
uniref:Uncharacterized protein n=1 Tax=Encephalitozoon cuniculi TaxID=6035 RepID=M1KLQ7_ENCCN|nr:hypothetical protein ECU10_0500 [Encephalitozoon cuniculi]